jgi:ribosomal protein S10
MTKYKIKLYSKNKQSLKRFSKLFKKPGVKLQNRRLVLSNLKRKRKRVTVLKSPHVNKKAQEQFQSVTYNTIIKCLSWEIKKNVLLLKKIKNCLFPDIRIKIEKFLSSNETQFFKSTRYSPKKTFYYDTELFSFKRQKEKKLFTSNRHVKNEKLLKKTLLYLKLLDNYGHLN